MSPILAPRDGKRPGRRSRHGWRGSEGSAGSGLRPV